MPGSAGGVVGCCGGAAWPVFCPFVEPWPLEPVAGEGPDDVTVLCVVVAFFLVVDFFFVVDFVAPFAFPCACFGLVAFFTCELLTVGPWLEFSTDFPEEG